MKKEKRTTNKDSLEIKIDPNMRDYSNDPYFVKKLADMDELMKMHPLPGARGKQKKNSVN